MCVNKYIPLKQINTFGMNLFYKEGYTYSDSFSNKQSILG